MPFNQKEYMKEYRKKNKDKLKEYDKEYKKNNKEKRKKQYAEWYEKNKEKRKEYRKEYIKTPQGTKLNRINNWKQNGLICDNYFELYEKYLLAEYCDVCNEKFKDTTDRCMDHDHDTGLFRQFLCQSCNRHDKWKEYVS